jgi:RNA recognition motif-containing protein
MSRKAMEPNQKRQRKALACMTNISRDYEPWFRVTVRNLPPRVNSSELQLLFSKHGRVSSAEVVYRKTRRSERMGVMTVSMVYAHRQDAVDAFKGPYLDGCKLEVTFVKERRRPRLGAPQLRM